MTLCMAAICVDDDGEACAVIAADRMVTIPGFIEFEHTGRKMVQPSSSGVAMIAGDTLVGTRLATDVVAEAGGASLPVAAISGRLAEHYAEVRNTEIEARLLRVRGLNWGTFYGSHNALNPQVTMLLDQQMAQFNLEVELLVVGVDDTGAHIHSVHNPGITDRQHDFIGFAATGSGGIHAMQAMIGFRHSSKSPLRETVFRVYASKRRSEVAPGVGLDTDVALVSASGVRFLSPDVLGRLSGLYDRYGKAAEEAQASELGRLTLEENGPGDDTA